MSVLMLCPEMGIAQDSFPDATRMGNFRQSVDRWSGMLEAEPQNDNLRFQLGALQFFHAVENMGQAWYRYGIRDNYFTDVIPMLRLPIPENPQPESIDYDKFRDVIQAFLDDLTVCEKTISQIKAPDVFIELDLAQVGMDWNRDGGVEPQDRLANTLEAVAGLRLGAGNNSRLVIRFDHADVYWLRGYCHMLSALAELFLAYDQSRVWEISANRFFDNADSKFDFLKEELLLRDGDIWTNLILDLVGFIHELRFDLQDADGVRRAREHLLQMIAMSRQMWELVLLETDNDREWIPNPKQTPPVPGAEITEEMVAGWQEFLNEFEDILEGRKLVPFWRGTNPKRGVNLHKALTAPQNLDVVLWVHGAGAMDYLEEDIPVTDPEVWQRINRIFRGQFIGFAMWIN